MPQKSLLKNALASLAPQPWFLWHARNCLERLADGEAHLGAVGVLAEPDGHGHIQVRVHVGRQERRADITLPDVPVMLRRVRKENRSEVRQGTVVKVSLKSMPSRMWKPLTIPRHL